MWCAAGCPSTEEAAAGRGLAEVCLRRLLAVGFDGGWIQVPQTQAGRSAAQGPNQGQQAAIRFGLRNRELKQVEHRGRSAVRAQPFVRRAGALCAWSAQVCEGLRLCGGRVKWW